MKTTWKWIPVLAIAAAAAYAQSDFSGDVPGGEPPPPSQDTMQPPPGMDGLPPPDMAGGFSEAGRQMPPPPHLRGHHGYPGKDSRATAEGRPGMPPPDGMGPSEEQRAEFAAFRQLCKDVREETDEAKKAELVETLRAKLGEMADRQRDAQKARLADAEKRIEEQKARLDQQIEALRGMIAEAEADRDAWIEGQVKCILSGERPPMRHPPCGEGFGGKKPEGRGGPCGMDRPPRHGPPPCGDGAFPPPDGMPAAPQPDGEAE